VTNTDVSGSDNDLPVIGSKVSYSLLIFYPTAVLSAIVHAAYIDY
jgi:hypothetical protein